MADDTSGGHHGYRTSKVAVNVAAKSLGIDPSEAGVGAFLLHTGRVSTGMTGRRKGQALPG